MRSRSVRVGLTALTLVFPLLIVAASEPGVGRLSWWASGGGASIGLAEGMLLAGMMLAGWSRGRLPRAEGLSPAREARRRRAARSRPARAVAEVAAPATAALPTLSAS